MSGEDSAEEYVVDGVTSQDHSEASPWRKLWQMIWTTPSAAIGMTLLVLLVLVALLAPVLAPYSPHEQVGLPFVSPSGKFWLGLDDGGYDVLSLLMYGLRISLIVGFGAAVISSVIGTLIGVLSGYFGGWVDTVLMRFTDYFLVIPLLPFMIVIAYVWGANLWHTVVVIGALSWTMTAIVLRAQSRTIRERVYIQRVRSMGAGHWRTVFHHLLPQVMPLVVANTVLSISYAIFTETALSFLGLGDPSRVSLGSMIEHAFQRAGISEGAWWAVLPPGILVAVIVIACSLVGRTIEDNLNPRLRTAHLSARSFRVREDIAAAKMTGGERV